MSGLELLLEYLTRYFPVLLFIFIALAFGVVTLLLSYLVQPKYPEPEKLSAYECGSNPFLTLACRSRFAITSLQCCS